MSTYIVSIKFEVDSDDEAQNVAHLIAKEMSDLQDEKVLTGAHLAITKFKDEPAEAPVEAASPTTL